MKRYCIVRGLGRGDEGKGSVVDAIINAIVAKNCDELVPEVIKEGGPQAAHWIVRRDCKVHRCEQIGSGIFTPKVRTFASKNMFISPSKLIAENLKLYEIGIYDGMKRLVVDSRCVIVTPLHAMIGRMLEVSRGDNRHGSTGLGVGQAVSDRNVNGDKVLTMGDMVNESLLREKINEMFLEKFRQAEKLVENNAENKELFELYQFYRNSLSPELLFDDLFSIANSYSFCIINDGEKYFQELLESGRNLIFEGSQGALLDPKYGFVPYVTKTRTTFKTAEDLLDSRVPRSEVEKVGVLRAYSTFHGAGPFVTEDDWLGRQIPEYHNGVNEWQGKFRIGWFDLLSARYGIMINRGVDSIALTNLDRLSEIKEIPICISYEYLGENEELLSDLFEYDSGDRIRITGFKDPDKPVNEQLAEILFNCKPMEFLKFQGWKEDISRTKKFEDLPVEAREYVNFLQSKEGLNVPISIVSVGPTSKQKIFL